MNRNQQSPINLINVSTQNNFCGYYALARRIINDNNFAVILDKFNQFYQTNWYFDELVEVLGKMHPEQAEIMLGLVIQHHYPLSSEEGTGLPTEDLQPICQALGYNPTFYFADSKDYLDSIQTALHGSLAPNEILISFNPPKGEATIGHYNLIEPDDEIFAMDMSRRDPLYQGVYTINNQGGDKFIDNIKESVAEIKPTWADKKKEQLLKDDEKLAWECAIADARAENLTFFKNPRTDLEIKTRLVELQHIELEYYNSKRMSK
ncbi:MAG: hypothetical protein E6K54_05930 [Gammaproteobacteria bacterium]|nr:MAG: hypothetical protein E6K54_05930 [Gammaproteobacteria bacterium]